MLASRGAQFSQCGLRLIFLGRPFRRFRMPMPVWAGRAESTKQGLFRRAGFQVARAEQFLHLHGLPLLLVIHQLG